MPNYKDDAREYFADADSPLGRAARNSAERKLTRDYVLSSIWPDRDIGLLERVDDAQNNGWDMCPWKKDPA